MHLRQILNLLTNEYSLVLATSLQDFQAVREIRKNVFSSKYNTTSKLLESKGYFFSEDDEQSFIYLLRHNATHNYIGTVRIFLINKYTPIKQLPMQKDGNVKDIDIFTQILPITEISRGALIHKLPKHERLSALELRTFLTFGLMIATRINFFLYPYSRIFSIMEPSLHHILKRQKVNFKQIGKSIDYYGICIPYAIERTKLLRDTEENMGKLTRYYLKQLCQNPEPFWQFIDNNPYLERSDIQLDRICQLFKTYGDDVDLELLLGEKEIITEL